MSDRPGWWPNWDGEIAVLVASGPSARTVDLAHARGRAKFIAVNTSWELCPWADVLYACDHGWWIDHKGAPLFEGLRVTQDYQAVQRYPSIQFVRSTRNSEVLVFDEQNTIGWGGNGGFHAINLAARWGAKRIVLVGYDMQLKGGSHWHGDHQTQRCNNPTAKNVERWRRVVDAAYAQLKARGIQGFNCSPISALEQWPKCSLPEAIDG